MGPELVREPAQVAELVDALVSGTSAFTGVEVRVLSWAPPSRNIMKNQDFNLGGKENVSQGGKESHVFPFTLCPTPAVMLSVVRDGSVSV